MKSKKKGKFEDVIVDDEIIAISNDRELSMLGVYSSKIDEMRKLLSNSVLNERNADFVFKLMDKVPKYIQELREIRNSSKKSVAKSQIRGNAEPTIVQTGEIK